MKTWPKYHKKHCWLVRKIVAFRLYRKIKNPENVKWMLVWKKHEIGRGGCNYSLIPRS